MYNHLLPTPRPALPSGTRCQETPPADTDVYTELGSPLPGSWAWWPVVSGTLPARPPCSLMPKAKQTSGKLLLGGKEPLRAAPLQWVAVAGGSYQLGKCVRKEGGCHSLCCPRESSQPFPAHLDSGRTGLKLPSLCPEWDSAQHPVTPIRQDGQPESCTGGS